MTRQQIREDINGRPLTDFYALERSPKAGRNMYVCPICGSGTGRNNKKTGALSINKNRVTCFSQNCFTDKGQDTLGALRILWGNCTETEAMEKAGYVIDRESTTHQKHNENTEHKEHQPEAPADYTLFYRECHEKLLKNSEALEYLHGRGITDDSIKRFNLGYCESWKHSKSGEKVPPTKRIIIPRTKGTYTARRIDKPENDREAQYIKQVQGRQRDLFNLEALEGAEACFIVEGELDAISLYQAGAASVVGIGAITNTGVLLEEAKKHPETVNILALDNDSDKEDGRNPGKEAQRNLAADMKGEGLEALSVDPADIYGEAKDGNEAFQKDPKRLEKVISYLQGKAQEIKTAKDEEREEELKKRTGEGMLEDFLSRVSTQRDFEPIATEIKDLDRALQGGFTRKTLVMLGAPPAMGKTALAQWIFENMASAGHDVLFINLEMSREQLLARSLSRIVWKYDKKDLNALDILRGYSWTEEQRESVLLAGDYYKERIAKNFIYNPDGVTNNINDILTAMKAETARIKAQGKPAPLVCIDYLQLIDSGERDAIEGMKGVIFKLKDFAKNENTVVFVVMANNRTSNKSGIVELESGRDTSAIEYSADILLGLSYTAIEDRRKYEDGEAKDGKPRFKEYDLEEIRRLKKEAYETGKPVPSVCNEISLKVLKNRFGDSERRAHFIFDGKHNTFTQREYTFKTTGEEWAEAKGNPFLTK